MSNPRQVTLETLSQRGPLPLDEIARAIRRSPLATRYHLGLLIGEGLVAAENTVHRQLVGRPQMLYTLAERAHTHLPKQYDTLAEELLAEVMRTFGEKEARALLRRAGRRLAETASPLRRGARIETRLNRATDFLSARGYLARWEKSEGDATLRIGNCPYHHIAFAHRQTCEMDLALIGGLLELPMKMTHCIVHQDSQCVFVVKPTSTLKK